MPPENLLSSQGIKTVLRGISAFLSRFLGGLVTHQPCKDENECSHPKAWKLLCFNRNTSSFHSMNHSSSLGSLYRKLLSFRFLIYYLFYQGMCETLKCKGIVIGSSLGSAEHWFCHWLGPCHLWLMEQPLYSGWGTWLVHFSCFSFPLIFILLSLGPFERICHHMLFFSKLLCLWQFFCQAVTILACFGEPFSWSLQCIFSFP